MTREQVIEWAKNSDYKVGYLGAMYNDPISLHRLEQFARLAREDMREQCAKVCDGLAKAWKPEAERCYTQDDQCAEACAEAIRNLEV
jgi:hypothetical protein